MQKVKCRRPGCGKEFIEGEGDANACIYHTQLPIFHDGVKRWPCCMQEAWDWDEFLKLKGCATGEHSSEAPKGVVSAVTSKPAVAEVRAQPSAPAVCSTAPRSIEDFNRECAQLEVSSDGLFKCANKGCNLEYKEEDNNSEACRYHPGVPNFRDGCKSWSCCGAKAYDWEEFMALPTCTSGPHVPKLVQK